MAAARPDHHNMLDEKAERERERERDKKKVAEKAQAPPKRRKRALEKEVVAIPKPGQSKVRIYHFRYFLFEAYRRFDSQNA